MCAVYYWLDHTKCLLICSLMAQSKEEFTVCFISIHKKASVQSIPRKRFDYKI